jgi:hypothetical protein
MAFQFVGVDREFLIYFFANDSIIFCNATTGECEALLELLKTYELSSGQKINSGKTTFFFSHNT